MLLARLAALCFATVAFTALPTVDAGAAADTPDAAQQRWPTDAALRKGMIAIRDLVRVNHSLITHRRMPVDHAKRFARAIKTQSDQILATSTVTGNAKSRLTELLREVTAGVEAVAQPGGAMSPIDGLIRVDEALAQYPKEFDHPGWAPVQSLD